MIREAIQQLVAGQDLDRATATASMDDIMSGEATDSQVAAFLIALRLKGETVDEMLGFVASIRGHATLISAPDGAVDTCGTGGDGTGTFNISTAAALVLRGAGAVVAKHGNRAASSRCGSADVLEALGIPMSLGPAEVEDCIRTAGIGFMLAPVFHPAIKNAAVPRKDIGVRTVFNVLGPLNNPAQVRRQALGVAAPEMAPRMIETLAALGHERALVFHSDDGMDELTTTSTSTVHELRDGEVRAYTINPSDLGLAEALGSDLAGGTAEENAAIIKSVLDGTAGAQRDVVVLNAAAGMVAAGLADDIATGIGLAAHSIDSGAARQALADFRAATEARAGAGAT